MHRRNGRVTLALTMVRALYAIPWLLLVSAGCGRPPQTEPVALPAVRKVILITIDTLRADHVASYGYPVETSPGLDSLVEKGVSFHRAYSHSATTKPAHSSLFTSLYPLEHGVVQNAQKLSEEFLTMAEMMASSGFRTGGFVSTDVPLNGNVSQGFEHWDAPVGDDPAKKSLYRTAEATVADDVEQSVDLTTRVFKSRLPNFQFENRFLTKSQTIIWSGLPAIDASNRSNTLSS